jgi:uncharacterized protein (DUF1684 family)
MTELTEFRKAKGDFMARDHDSPLTDDQRAAFSGLSYFGENPDLRFELDVREFDTRDVVEMQTSTGDVASYLRWGKIAFDVEGQPAELTLYREPHSGEVFLPFADATSGTETYGSGRYLDTHELPNGKVLVDFNYTYNPYCAYNEQWSCPLTPFENRLLVPIRAGEKSFK